MSCVCSTELLSPQAGRMHAGCLLGLLSAQNCDGELVRGCCWTGQKSAGLVHTTAEHCVTVSEMFPAAADLLVKVHPKEENINDARLVINI